MMLGDRKSTRLNSSHQIISYAVFCLKKKTDRKSTRLNSSHQINSYAVFCLQKKKNQEKSSAAKTDTSNQSLCRLQPVSQAFAYAQTIARCAQHNYVFFFNDTATTEIYTLSLHDALPI